MKRLLLMRHGDSGLGDESLPDLDRTLTESGAVASKATGAWIVANALAPEIVLVSAAQRTVQTWDVLKALLTDSVAIPSRDLYLASPGTLLANIEKLPDNAGTALVIGHNPGLESLGRLMAGPGSSDKATDNLLRGFPPAGLAVFELNGENWRTMSAEGGRLTEFVRPVTAS
jgi:phosphohistidine phosphatase